MKPTNLNHVQSLELCEILAQYDLGELVDFERNQRGFVNTSFAIEAMKNSVHTRYFLRKYKPDIHEEELIFEHNLINHLAQRTAPPIARLHHTSDGSTYLHRGQKNGDPSGSFYAIFDHLPGEDRYTWVNPHCSTAEISSAARTLAQFHSAMTTLQPKGKRYEPKILDLLPLLIQTVTQGLEHSKNTIFDDYLTNSHDAILQNIRDTLAVLQTPDAQHMPQIVIHCDYHPGNIKFQGEAVSGLFDFDWSKVDYRCFDLGLALWYFFAEWEGEQDGRLRTEEARHFLVEYQLTMQSLPGIGPLTSSELSFLPAMIDTGNLYVLNWAILDYFNKTKSFMLNCSLNYLSCMINISCITSSNKTSSSC